MALGREMSTPPKLQEEHGTLYLLLQIKKKKITYWMRPPQGTGSASRVKQTDIVLKRLIPV